MSSASDTARRTSATRLSRKLLHVRVAADLRDRIITGRLEPGVKLSIGALAEEIGVSVTPLREALKLLPTENLIDLTPNRGASVSPVSEKHTRHLFEVIAGIEALAAELACRRMTDAERAELRSLHDNMQALAGTADRAGYFEMNRTIHDRIVDFARNPILSEQRGRLAQQAERVRYLALGRAERRSEGLREHFDLMAAFADRDPDRARRIHLIASGDQTIELLSQRTGRSDSAAAIEATSTQEFQ
ncbi:MAG: GntR family transcriptional regulator [Rhodobacteraceae bacterium]|nr:GntR family transcriptional regulator [Paracoccaceae bacterium]